MRLIAILLVAAALAGCTQAAEPTDGTSTPSNGFAPQMGHQEDVEGDISLVGDFSTCGAGFCIDAVATNEGSEPAYVSNICQPAFGERMEHEGKQVHPREPQFYCQAWGVREMAPGEEMEIRLEWDGQLWNDETGAMEPAPEGSAYQWFATFFAYGDDQGADRKDLEVGFTVVIGET